MTGDRDKLLQAVLTENWTAIDAMGWKPVLRDLKGWWPKGFTASDAAGYIRLLGDRDPTVVYTALESLVSAGRAEYRPSPAQIAFAIGGSSSTTTSRTNAVAQLPRPDLRPEALATVRRLLDDGAAECACGPGRTLAIGPDGVVRCGGCHGLDPGLVDLALDLEAAA